jgi:hypothetical protein
MMPLLLGLAFNAINLGYFWFMIIVLAAAPRQGAQYVTQGGQALTVSSVPSTTAVKNLVYENLTGAIGATVSSAQVRVCSSSSAAGVNPTTHIAGCDSYGPGLVSFLGPSADPEAPVFVLHRVDVAYRVTPIIRGAAFHVVLPSDLTFKRQVSMRSLY